MIGETVDAKKVYRVWGEVEGLIAAACEFNGGRYTKEDYFHDLADGLKQLWLVREHGKVKGVVVTEIAPFPRKKVCIIDICTGNELSEWLHMVGLVEAWAKSIGCHQMFNLARPGMERGLKPLGYTKTHVLLEKNL